MRRFFYFLIPCFVFCLVLWSLPAIAQTDVEVQDPEPEEQQEPPEAVAGKDRNVKVGQTVVFDGTGSFNPLDTELQYVWDFGDGQKGYASEVTHVYRQPGEYIVKLVVDNGVKTAEDMLTVLVEQDIVILIADQTISTEQVEEIKNRGKARGVLFVDVVLPRGESSYIAEAKLTERLLLVQDDLQKADLIITWTRAGVGLNALMSLEQRLNERESSPTLSQLGFSNKVVVDISDHRFFLLQRVGEMTFGLVKPQAVVLAREQIIDRILLHPEADGFIELLASSREEFRLIQTPLSLERFTFSNPLFRLEHYLLGHGVPLQTILLILFLPVIAAIVAFARVVLGVRAFGIFVPTIISLSLIATGLRYGLFVFAVVLFVATLSRYVFRKLRFLYLARISLVLTIVSLSIIALLFAGAVFGRFGFLAVSIFPILVMVTLTENFVSVQIDKGLWVATRITIETVLLAIVGYFLANWGTFRVLVFGYPLFVYILILLLTFILGRFVGLRLGEYLRFRQVIKYADISTKK